MTQLVEDPLEASGPGDARRSAEGQCRAEPDQQRMLGRLPVEMWLGPKEALEGHRTRIGRVSDPLKPSAL